MARTECRLSTGEGWIRSGDREHHIGQFNPSDAMLRRTRSDLEENHEPDRRYLQLDKCD